MSEKENLDAIEPAEEATAENVTTPSSSGNWWSPWLEAAKTKSTEVLEFVKKDFNEISTVVKSEANAVVNSTAAVLKDTLKLDEPESTASSMKKSMSTFLESVTNVLTPAADDEGEEALLIQNDKPVPLSRFQTRLFSLIRNSETFTEPIEAELMPQFESWLSVADEQMTRERLTKLLVALPDLHNLYEALVPEKVSHVDFWQRYLFRKALLEDEESMREAKEKRDQALAEKVQWEKENFAEGIDLTEEEQIKILADYENERKTSETNAATSPPASPQKENEKLTNEKSNGSPKKKKTTKATPTVVSKAPTSSDLIASEKADDSSSKDNQVDDVQDEDADWEKDFDLDMDEK